MHEMFKEIQFAYQTNFGAIKSPKEHKHQHHFAWTCLKWHSHNCAPHFYLVSNVFWMLFLTNNTIKPPTNQQVCHKTRIRRQNDNIQVFRNMYGVIVWYYEWQSIKLTNGIFFIHHSAIERMLVSNRYQL